MQLKRIVITGMGCLTPLGNSITEYWNNLRNGVSGCDFITLFDASKFKTRFACEIKNFDPNNHLDRKELRGHSCNLVFMIFGLELISDMGL